MASGKRGREVAQIVHKKRGIERHFENAAGQRKPGLLVSPEIAKPAAHPDVEAALLWDGAGKFADHHGGGNAPEQRGDEQNGDRASVARHFDDVFEAVRAARDHEVSGSGQRKNRELAVRGNARRMASRARRRPWRRPKDPFGGGTHSKIKGRSTIRDLYSQ